MPTKFGNPSERVRKTSGDLDDTEKALVTTTKMVVKEGNTDMLEKKEKKVVKEAITLSHMSLISTRNLFGSMTIHKIQIHLNSFKFR